MHVVAFVTEASVIRRILDHLSASACRPQAPSESASAISLAVTANQTSHPSRKPGG